MLGMAAKMAKVAAGTITVLPPRGAARILKSHAPPMVGYLPRKTDWIHHRFNLFAFGLVTLGEGQYSMNDGPAVRLRPGSLFAVFPGPVFHYGPDPGTAWEEYHVGLFGNDARPWIESGAFPRDGSVRRIGDLEATVAAFQALLALMRRSGPGDIDRAILGAQRLLVDLFYGQAHMAKAERRPRRIEQVLDLVRARLDERVSFQKLAKTHGVSYSRLRHQIREATGLPPAQYLTRLRCQHACALLVEGDLSIKEIAARVGIHDPYAFSRTFKRHTGLSPRNWRNRSAAIAPAG
jgi:AraC family transcriptional regulator, arabinose operon regulatory protein